jgi:hypothetical protein
MTKIYLGNDEYEITFDDGKKIKLYQPDIDELIDGYKEEIKKDIEYSIDKFKREVKEIFS